MTVEVRATTLHAAKALSHRKVQPFPSDCDRTTKPRRFAFFLLRCVARYLFWRAQPTDLGGGIDCAAGVRVVLFHPGSHLADSSFGGISCPVRSPAPVQSLPAPGIADPCGRGWLLNHSKPARCPPLPPPISPRTWCPTSPGWPGSSTRP